MPRLLQRAVDWGIGGIIFIAPLVMGGRHPIGRLVFVVLVCCTAVCWLAERSLSRKASWRWSGMEWIILAAIALICFQLAPLPSALMASLSPGTAELLPVWQQADSDLCLGTWSHLSLAPIETRSGLIMLLAYGALFVVIVNRINAISDVERMLRWIAIAVFGMAAFGVTQLLIGNGKFLWLYSHPFRDTLREVKGTFINENHFAGFLALGVGPLIWWLQQTLRENGAFAKGKRGSRSRASRSGRSGSGQLARGGEQRLKSGALLLGAALVVITLASLLTFSRGGVIVAFVAAAVTVVIYASNGFLQRRALVVLAIVGLISASSLFVYGYQPLLSEIRSLSAGSIDELDQNFSRRRLWAADIEAFRNFPLVGTGIGSHAEVYPVYFKEYAPVEFTHAESGYIQILQESGLAGITLLLLTMAAGSVWCFRALWKTDSRRVQSCAAAITAGLIASALHSVWDFVWFIPACMSLVVILLACACRLQQLNSCRLGPPDPQDTRIPIRQPAWCVATLGAMAVAAMMINEHIPPAMAAPHWDGYLRQSLADSGDDLDRDVAVASMVRDLEATLHWDPKNARARARLANLYMRRFDQEQFSATNPVELAQLRRTVLASRFPTQQAQEQWLTRAIGENRKFLTMAWHHANCALQLSPLQGESYVDLSELAFLRGLDEKAARVFVDQGLLVRPHRGAVLFAAGRQAVLDDDLDTALSYWKEAFRHDPEFRALILERLAGHMPVSFFLSEFSPNMEGMREVFWHYRKIGRTDQAQEVGLQYAGMLEAEANASSGRSAAKAWYKAFRIYDESSDPMKAISCLERAVQYAPGNFTFHRELAIQMLVHKRYGDATDQLRWCLRRTPHDPTLQRLFARAKLTQSTSDEQVAAKSRDASPR